MNKDYYKTLNINRNATQDEIKKAFRKLSKTHHPDKGGDENVFKELSEAYDTLGDGSKRAEYDNRLNNPFHGRHGGGGPSMDDIFNQFFGGRQQNQRQQRKGRSLNIPLTVTLEDVFFGEIKKLRYNRQVNCGTCRGSGGNSHPCNMCKGRGFVEKAVGNAFFRQIQRENCPQCNGSGKIIVEPCGACGSAGQIKQPKTVDFRIPVDLMTGQVFTIRNHGDEIEGGIPGDLNIQVVIARHPHFKVLDRDLVYDVEIPIIDMLLGTDLEIPHFSGPLKAKIPPLSKVTESFNVRGKGMNSQRGKGDLIIKPQVKIPNSLTKEEEELLMNLKTKENFS